MHLYDFAWLSKEEDSIQILKRMINKRREKTETVQSQLFKDFEARWANKEILYYNKNGDFFRTDDRAEIALFKTSFQTEFQEPVWAKFDLNKAQKPKWFGVLFMTEPELLKKIISSRFVIGNIVFDEWDNGFTFLEQLAAKAIPEKWEYEAYKSKIPHPILKNYVEHMLHRLEWEKKVLNNGTQVVFNTGLLDKYFREICVMCDISNDNEFIHKYVNPTICVQGDDLVTSVFDTRVPRAEFFKDIRELIFDSSMEVEPEGEHIIEDNYNRIPKQVKEHLNQTQIYMNLKSAITMASKLAEVNYKLVVPQYWYPTKSIQFLMPIYFSGEFQGKPDRALVLENRGSCYRGTTILELDMAYQNARLIAKPDDFWLNP